LHSVAGIAAIFAPKPSAPRTPYLVPFMVNPHKNTLVKYRLLSIDRLEAAFILSFPGPDHFVVFLQFWFRRLVYFKGNDINPQTKEVTQ
jgi:hypothetical protein